MGMDAAGVQPGNPHSFDRYVYANNNPYTFVDSDGNWPEALKWVSLPTPRGDMTSITPNDMRPPSEKVGTTPLDVAGYAASAAAMIESGATVATARSSLGRGAVNITDDIAKETSILRDAAKGKGNFGLGSATRAESERLGKAWIGDGYKTASDGKTLISSDGLRHYRPPSPKPNSPYATTGTQSNFEQRWIPEGRWQGNGHLNITD